MSTRFERLHNPAFVALCRNDPRILREYNRSILFTKIITIAVFVGLVNLLHWLCRNATLERLLYFPAVVFILLTLGFIVRFKHIVSQSALGHWIRQRLIFRLRGCGCHNLSSEDRGEGDPWQTDRLCPLCKRLVNTSWLLYGSPWILGSAREQHKFYQSFSGVNTSAGEMCHLCTILWQSIDPTIRKRAITEEEEEEEYMRHAAEDDIEITSRIPVSSNLCVRVWKEVPPRNGDYIPSTIYIQLFKGDECLGNKLEISEVKNRDYTLKTTCRNTGDDVTMLKIRNWITTCQTKHPRCVKSGLFNLPTRLLFVGDEKEPNALRLCYPTLESENRRYVALSHCWGGANMMKLTLHNHESLLQGISAKSLPKNFQDAISITRRIGSSYLWIDSLCIIQDSTEDWCKESLRMSDVYSNALCTIALNCSNDPFGGCFRDRNPLDYYPLHLLRKSNGMSVIQSQDDNLLDSLIEDEVNRSPLNRRGWAFQERSLSTRVIHFGAHAVLFECNSIYASEFDPNGKMYQRSRYFKRSGGQYTQEELRNRENMSHLFVPETGGRLSVNPGYRRDAEIEKVHDDARFGYRGSLETLVFSGQKSCGYAETFCRLEYNRRWYDLVAIYSERQLTRTSDKLFAFSGIAGKIQKGSGLSYMAGLWKENLVYNLLWFSVGNPMRRPRAYRAPSWSWVSTDSPIRHWFSVGDSLCTYCVSYFKPDDLMEWREFGEEAKIIATGAELDGCEVPDPERDRFALFFIDIEATVVEITATDELRYKTLNGKYWIRFSPNVMDVILEDQPKVIQMLRLCGQIAKKSAAYGLLLRQSPNTVTSSAMPVPTFERIGCFKLGDADAFFEAGEPRRIRIV